MSLSQAYLDKEEKESNVYINSEYAQLRVGIFQYLYKQLKELMYSERQVSLMVDDLLEIIDTDRKKTNK